MAAGWNYVLSNPFTRYQLHREQWVGKDPQQRVNEKQFALCVRKKVYSNFRTHEKTFIYV